MMGEGCKICGTELKNDLFAMVAQELVCCVCKFKYIGGLPTTNYLIGKARKQLGLQGGEMLEQDRAEECRNILGR
jgi:hypothetical protein